MSQQRTISNVRSIRPLNQNEKDAIRDALEHYIALYPRKKTGNDLTWSQRIILEDMLDGLMWAEPGS